MMPDLNLFVIAPEIALVGTGMLVLIVGLFIDDGRNEWLAALSLGGLAAASVAVYELWSMRAVVGLGGMATADHFALFLAGVFVVSAALTVLMSVSYRPIRLADRGEYYALVLFATAGMMLMAASTDLIVLFLGLEMFSICLYILSGFLRPQEASEESALKYFLIGAFASGFLLYGIALTFGATGVTGLAAIAGYVAAEGLRTPMLLMGLGLIVVGFGFKIAMVPFHMWTPDVYQGAPTSVTAFMSVGAKAGGFAALSRILISAFPLLQPYWVPLVAALTALTTILANVVAIAQTNIKRMLAYSSIAHAGYILIGLVAGNTLGVASLLFYLLAYLFTNLGAFAVVIAQEGPGQEQLELRDYAGLSTRRPLLAAAMALFMLSLTGVPPTGGFVGKLYVFSAAIQRDLVWLTVVGALTTVISAFFYLRVIVIMYMWEPAEAVVPGSAGQQPQGARVTNPLPAEGPLPLPLQAALVISVLGTLAFGLFPTPFIAWAQQAATLFGS